MGAEGWELVSELVESSILGTNAGGWVEASVPVEISWTFKRAVGPN